MSQRQKCIFVGLFAGILTVGMAAITWRAIPDFDSARLMPVGQGFYLFGVDMQRPLLAEHSTALFQLIAPLVEAVGEPLGRQLFTLVHVTGTAILLAAAIGRRDAIAGLAAAITFATMPIAVVSSSMVTREPVAAFWVLATFLLLPRASRSSSPPRTLLYLAGTAVLAATSDSTAALCILCFAFLAAWNANANLKRTWLPAVILALAAGCALFLALPWSWDQLILLFDARTYHGHDHLVHVGNALITLIFPGSMVVIVWRLVGWSTGRILGAPPAPDPLVPVDTPHRFSTISLTFALILAQLANWLFIREPTWQATVYYLAPCIAALVGLEVYRLRGTTVFSGLTAAALLVMLIGPSVGSTTALINMSPVERATFSVGWKASQLEDRRAFIVAEGMAPHDGSVYFGPGLICSTECMDLGPLKHLVMESKLDGVIGKNAVLVARGADIAQHPRLLERLDTVVDEAVGVVRLNGTVSGSVKKARWLIPLRSRAWRAIHETPATTLMRQTGTVDRSLPPR